MAVEEALLHSRNASNPSSQTDFILEPFPSLNDEPIPVDDHHYSVFSAAKVTSLMLVMLMTFAVAPLSLLLYYQVQFEKSKGLMGVLRQLGMKESLYWSSYVATCIPWLIAMALEVVICSAIVRNHLPDTWKLPSLTRVDYGILFVVQLIFGWAMMGFFLMVSALVGRSSVANMAAGLLIIIITIMQIVPTAISEDVWLVESGKSTANVLFFLPWAGFAKCWSDIIRRTAVTKENSDVYYSWSSISSTLTFNGTSSASTKPLEITSSSTESTLLIMFGYGFLYLVLAWYFNQVWSPDEGFSQPWYFPFDLHYWSFKSKVDESIEGDKYAELKCKSIEHRSLVVRKLTKSYQSCTAVREFTQSMEPGKIYALLGVNGAGKSTLVKMLSGSTNPTHGQAYLDGLSLREDTTLWKAAMGICSQDDLLWDNMTAKDHVMLFSQMRGRTFSQSCTFDAYCDEILSQVHLFREDASSKCVGTFSGGMKRRLSLILSTICRDEEPLKILFLDEPTTGMDPANKHLSWKVIEREKRSKIVILTTHSMEEADSLGDHICIMHNGQLRASGTSLFLKSHYGTGYRIKIAIHGEEQDGSRSVEVRDLISRLLSSASIKSDTGGQLVLELPRKDIRELPCFIRELDSLFSSADKETRAEWGVSSTTLEEVFLKLCAENKGVVDETLAPNHSDIADVARCVLCSRRRAEPVTLFTKASLPVLIDNVVCKYCADPEPISEGSGLDPLSVKLSGGGNLTSSATAAYLADQEIILDSDYMIDADEKLMKPEDSSREDRIVFDRQSLTSFSVWKQSRAVFLNNFSEQMKQKKTNICLVVVSALIVLSLMLSLGLIKSLTDSVVGKATCPQGWNNLSDSLDYCNTTAVASKILSCLNTEYCNSYGKLENDFEATFYSTVLGSISADYLTKTLYGAGLIEDRDHEIDDLLKFRRSRYDRSPAFRFIDSSTHDYSMRFQQSLYDLRNSTISQLCQAKTNGYDYRRSWFDPATVHLEFAYDQSLDLIEKYVPEFGLSRPSSGSYMISYHAFDLPYQKIHGVKGDICYTSGPKVRQNQGHHVSILIHSLNALRWRRSSNSIMSDLNGRVLKKHHLNLSWTSDSGDQLLSVKNLIMVQMLLLLSLILFPSMLSRIARERENRNLELMQLHGMKTRSYWLGCYVWYLASSGSLNMVVTLLCMAIGIFPFSGAGNVVFVFLMISWTHASACLVFLLSSIFRKPVVTVIVGNFSICLLSTVSAMSFLGGNERLVSMDQGFGLSWFPPLNFAVNVARLSRNDFSGKLFASIFLGQIMIASLLGLVGIFINWIQVGSSWKVVVQKIGKLTSIFRSRPDSTYEAVELTDEESNDDDIDVVMERNRIQNPAVGKNLAVKLRNLVKEFDSGKVIRQLDLGLNYGECFGFLGPNGAGKTTTINIMTGSLKPTAGEVKLCGVDVLSVSQASRFISVCPQHDVIWTDLTVQEHLLLFARLKGATLVQERAWVQHAADIVGLDGDSFTTKASALSGGMRRRLSVAMAVLGESPILVLDEPSTGLDPDNRRGLWNVITKLKEDRNRCIIVTTHSMEEAEALANRIGIFAQGRLRCIGTPMHLKKRFGYGYRISMRLQFSHPLNDTSNLTANLQATEQSCMANLRTAAVQFICPLAKLEPIKGSARSNVTVTQLPGNAKLATWSLQCALALPPTVASELGDVLANVDRFADSTRCMNTDPDEAMDSCIVVEWSLTQSSLEDVFVRVVQNLLH